MKLFGWGCKSKVPPPQTVLQQVKKTDPRNSSRHGVDRGIPLGHTMQPCKSTVRKQQGLFGVDDDGGYLHKENGCDESKLQDIIRFVFSHEQEGLLAIGTFALEQLAAIRDTIDNNRKNSPDDGFESCTDMMQSSDDEADLPRSLKTGLKSTRHELPVYGSSDSESSDENQAFVHQNVCTKISPAPSKALTLYKPGCNRSPVAGTKPIVLLTALPPELRRRSLDPASPWVPCKPYVPLGHWTDSVPPPVVLPQTHIDQELYYSSYFCGLFRKPSRTNAKRISKSTLKDQIVHIQQDDYKTKDKKSMSLGFGTNGVPSLGKLAKLWRSNCKQARIAPERFSRELKSVSSNGGKSGEVLTTPVTQAFENRLRPPGRLPSDECSPKVAEFRRRVAMHERNMVNAQEELRDGVMSNRSDGGHWIKTDSEYVVLEM